METASQRSDQQSVQESYDVLAQRIIDNGILNDPWTEGLPRFAQKPLILSASRQRELYRAAESVASVYNEVCQLCENDPSLVDGFLQLTPFQKAMWESSAPLWHGLARADIFMTDEGLQFTEINSDTPTGEAEAVVLNELLHAFHPGVEDPNAGLGPAYKALLDEFSEPVLAAGLPKRMGIVYPTEFTEDLALVRLFRAWFESWGWEVVLGSPYNLSIDQNGTLRLFDTPVAAVLRHYKTDWWGERQPVWSDEEIRDREPLSEPLGMMFAASLQQRVAILNPFGAVIPQNKRSMALMWEKIHRFSPFAQQTIRKYIPFSSRLEVMHLEQLLAEKDDWVLKSDYGAEGEEVILGRLTPEREWKQSLQLATSGHWIAQRYFEATRDTDGHNVNYGVFLVAG
ncbi:MAG: glutathionylspermidine synthase family protein, partial [Spirochaetales bacterium]